MARPTGAVGDGVTDDTAALQAWLDAGNDTIEDGNFLTSAALTLPGDGRRLTTRSARIIASIPDQTMLTVPGNHCHVSARLDGADKANYGVKTTGNDNAFYGGVYENFWSSTSTARAIEATTAGGVRVYKNMIRKVHSVGDATFGNGPGFARAVVVTATQAATTPSLIEDNIISDITGEEGDAVAVLFWDGVAAKFHESLTTIRGNQISNVTRRFIKMQGSGTVAKDNRLFWAGLPTPVAPSNCIDAVLSDRISVIGNRIEANPLLVGVSVVGGAGAVITETHIEGNQISQPGTKNVDAIYVNYADEPAVRNNVTRGGRVNVVVGNSSNPLVALNDQFGGIASARSIQMASTNTGGVSRGNANFNRDRAIAFTNDGSGAVSEGNYTAL